MSYNKLDDETPVAPAVAQQSNFDGGYLSINHYRQYFDLNTAHFFERIGQNLNPFSKLDTQDQLTASGDLYGAIWITGTVLVLLFFCHSISELFTEWWHLIPHSNDNTLERFITSLNLLYGYLALMPLCIYLYTRFHLHVDPLWSYSSIASVYGYSNIWWTPLAVLSLFQVFTVDHSVVSTIIQWILSLLGGILSGVSIGSKFAPFLSNFPLIIVLVLAHIGFTIAVKVSFFGALV